MAERRKTAHLTEGFREFVNKEVNNVTGLNLKPEQAWAIFRIAYKIPMRFLFTLPDSEVDSYGDKSIPVPGVGQFKIYRAKPTDTKKVQKNGDVYYPRFKFYPTSAIISEVEKHFGITDSETEKIYQRVIKSEQKMIEQTRNQIQKMMANGSGSAVQEKAVDELGKAIREAIRAEIRAMSAVAPTVKVENKTAVNASEKPVTDEGTEDSEVVKKAQELVNEYKESIPNEEEFDEIDFEDIDDVDDIIIGGDESEEVTVEAAPAETKSNKGKKKKSSENDISLDDDFLDFDFDIN